MEYKHIPLGGNRKGIVRQIVNLAIVWFLTGLWHGAYINFVLWGVYYGILLVIEKFLLKNVLKALPAILQHFYTMLLVMVGWSLFSWQDMADAAGSLSWSKDWCNRYFFPEGTMRREICRIVLVIVLLLSCVAMLVNSSYNPFLYFRF